MKSDVKSNMKRIVAFSLLLLVSLPAFALKKGQVKYVGGTVHSLTADTVGGLDIASDTSLTFESPEASWWCPMPPSSHCSIPRRWRGIWESCPSSRLA